jgi:hypothetical protein
MTYHTIAAAKDPWVPFDKGGGKGKAITPEPAATGAILLTACLILLAWRRFKK